MPSTLIGPLIDARRLDAWTRRWRRRVRRAARSRAARSWAGSMSVPRSSRCRAKPRSSGRDVRADTICVALFGFRRGHPVAARCPARPVLVRPHLESAGGRAVPVGGRLGLRHRQRQYGPVGSGDRRRLRWREGNRRRPRKRIGCLEEPICAARPRASITAATFRWPRAWRSTFKPSILPIGQVSAWFHAIKSQQNREKLPVVATPTASAVSTNRRRLPRSEISGPGACRAVARESGATGNCGTWNGPPVLPDRRGTRRQRAGDGALAGQRDAARRPRRRRQMARRQISISTRPITASAPTA